MFIIINFYLYLLCNTLIYFMNYTLNQLQIFLKIVDTQSITKASEQLNLTQPAVSIQLKNFQNQFDLPLTEIHGRKIHITEFGHEIANAADKIIQQVQAINYKTLAYKGLLSGKLKVSIVSTGKYVMPFFLSDFIKLHQGIDLTMEVTNKDQVINSLEANQVDFALVSILPKNILVDKLDLLQNKLYLVGQSNHKLPKKSSVKQVLESLPLIFREQGSGTRQIMENYMNVHQVMATKKMELSSNEAVKQAILAGLGFSIMPLIGIKNELKNGALQIIPLKGLPIITTWQLVWLKGKKHSAVSQAFLDYLKLEGNNVVQNQFSWYEDY